MTTEESLALIINAGIALQMSLHTACEGSPDDRRYMLQQAMDHTLTATMWAEKALAARPQEQALRIVRAVQ